MSIISIFNKKPIGRKIGLIEIECTIREVDTFKNEITNLPVESGFNKSDNIRQQPEELQIEGEVSNTPIEPFALINSISSKLSSLDSGNRRNIIFDQLTEYAGFGVPKQAGISLIKKNSEPTLLDIVTPYRIYSNMIIKNLSIPQDNTTNNKIKFIIDFIKFNIVQSPLSITTFVNNDRRPRTGLQAIKKLNAGKDTVKPIDGSSILSKTYRGTLNLFGVDYLGRFTGR